MRLFPDSLRRDKCVPTLAFTAQLLLAGAVLLSSGAAQEAGGAPPEQPEPPPPPVVFQAPIPADQFAFLNDYAGHPVKELLKDKRFHSLLKLATPRTEYHYGRDMPLQSALEMVLDGSKLTVEVRDGRYALVPGNNGPYLRGRGFLWLDMQNGIALGGFYFQPTNGEPTPTLTVFSRQLKDTSLSMSQLPLDFTGDLIQWATQMGIPPVVTRYFIPDNGKKYVLIHDEDYCDHPENQPAPPESQCQALNADAADVDMNAAYFMQETRNQANATAWMLGPDQIAWIGLRNQTCGGGPAGLPCRIRITRQRTRVLLGGSGRR
jgi:uncharacterized protein YecT (DUF1311 family)